jgi:hypothetical protein
MLKIVSFILFRIVITIRYLGGDSDAYSDTNPGNNITTCLADNDHKCLLVNNYSRNFGNVNLNSNVYTIGSTKSSSETYLILTMQNDFSFISYLFLFNILR